MRHECRGRIGSADASTLPSPGARRFPEPLPSAHATLGSIPRAVPPRYRQHAGGVAPEADVADQREHACRHGAPEERSEEHTSELQSLMRISYAVFCLKKKTK